MTVLSDFESALANRAAEALIQLAADRPGLTVEDVRSLMGAYPMLGAMTLTELFGALPAAGGRGKGRKGKAVKGRKGDAPAVEAAPKKADKGGKRKGWNVRTEQGRAELDAAVLGALKDLGGVEVSAEQLRAGLGASPHQLRTSLNRHIESGAVTFSGKARGTRYSLV